MLFNTFGGQRSHLVYRCRVRVGVSASHYGANPAIYIAAGRKWPPVQVTEDQDKHGHHWSARCSEQMLLA